MSKDITNRANTVCANCQNPLGEGDQWCSECGYPSGADIKGTDHSSPCSKCGEPTDPLDQWCASCGTSLISTASAAPPTADQSVPNNTSAPPSLLQPIGSAGAISTQPISSAVTGAISTQATSVNSALPGKTARRGWNSVFSHATCGGCFAQDVKDAPTCYKCGAQFLTPEEIAEEEAELAKTDFDIARDRAQAVIASAGVKTSSARASLNAASQETLKAAANTKAGKNVQNYWVGWAVLAFVVLVGGFGLKLAVNSGQRKSEAIRATAAAAIPTPRVPSPEEIRQADVDARWRKADAYNARAEAQQRAEAEAKRRDAEAITQVMTAEAQRIQQSETLDVDKSKRQMAERENEEEKLVMYECSDCGQTIMLPKRLTETHVAVNVDHFGGLCPKGDQFHPYHKWRKARTPF